MSEETIKFSLIVRPVCIFLVSTCVWTSLIFQALPSRLLASNIETVFLGTTSILIRDDRTNILIDGFCSRPSLGELLTRKLSSISTRVVDCLDRANISELSGLFVSHTHYDHVMDAGLVAKLTGASVYGSKSTLSVAKGEGVPSFNLKEIADGDLQEIGDFNVRIFETPHGPPTLFKGDVKQPWRPPQKFSRYRVGKNYSFHIEHRKSANSSILVVPSAGVQKKLFKDVKAKTVFLSIGMLGWQSTVEIERFWQNTVLDVGAEVVILTHWDDFRVPLDRPLKKMPFPPDKIERSFRQMRRLSSRDGISLIVPLAFQVIPVSD